jgi:BCD family chlorophyll transporter-like MFS transporter
LALGAWGAVQATAAGIAIGVGGIFRDIIAGMASRNYFGEELNSPATGYCGVYLIEIVLLLITISAMANFTWPAKSAESVV